MPTPRANGIEIYRDRSSEGWSWQGGMVQMGSRRLDLQDLTRTAGDTAWNGLPEGSLVGHIHLQVGEAHTADKFYAGVLGLDVVSRVPGASFYSSGGYHHHVASNTWNSAGAGLVRPA